MTQLQLLTMTYFVVIEGPDGSGKTTVCQLVNQKLQDSGVACRRVREPGGTEFGEALRDILLHDRRSLKVPGVCHSMLLGAMSFANACADVPDSAVYLSDRWAPISSRVYQTTAALTPEDQAMVLKFWDSYMELLQRPESRARKPDFFVYLKVDERVANARASAHAKPDNMDPQNIDLVRRRVEAYDRLLTQETLWGTPVFIVNTTDTSAEEVAEQIVNQIISRCSGSDTPPDGVNVVQL